MYLAVLSWPAGPMTYSHNKSDAEWEELQSRVLKWNCVAWDQEVARYGVRLAREDEVCLDDLYLLTRTKSHDPFKN